MGTDMEMGIESVDSHSCLLHQGGHLIDDTQISPPHHTMI